MRSILLLIHLAGVIVWVGGMFFAHFFLRPVAAEQLQPPQRLPLMAAVLGRFFAAVSIAIAGILASGFALFAAAGFSGAPWRWHAMLALGLTMSIIFALIRWRFYPTLRRAVSEGQWPAAQR